MNGMGLPLSNSHPQRSRPWSAHNLNSWDIAFLVFVDAAQRRTCFVVLFGCSLFPDGGGRVGKVIYAGWMRIFPNLKLRAFWQDCPNPKQPAVLSFENVKKIDIQTAKLGFPTAASIESDVTWQLFFGYKWICASHTRWLKRVILKSQLVMYKFWYTFYFVHLSEIAKGNSYSAPNLGPPELTLTNGYHPCAPGAAGRQHCQGLEAKQSTQLDVQHMKQSFWLDNQQNPDIC